MPKRKAEDTPSHGSKPQRKWRRKRKNTQGTQTYLTSSNLDFSENSWNQLLRAYNDLLHRVETAAHINCMSISPDFATRMFHSAVNGNHLPQPAALVSPRDIVSADTYLCSPDDAVPISYPVRSTLAATFSATDLFRDITVGLTSY
jgi:hypothetical protein